ncbi:serine hydrolase [candidate division KSB1 bacterium]|nr:MAG: serine hydrolase [candidate division KSB1 bacterium]
MQKLFTSRSTRSVVLFLLIGFGISYLSAKDSNTISGHWEGQIELPGQTLGINIDFFVNEENILSGDISIPLQGAKDLPLSEISLTGKKIRFKLPGVPGNAAFTGEISEDGRQISGTFHQSGQDFAFQIRRAVSKAAKVKGTLQGFDAFVSQAITDWQVPGLAMAVVCGDEVVFKQGFGFRDMEKKLPVTPKTLFAIGSSTKAFTTFVLGTLVDEGKLDWDKPLRNYLPDFELKDPFISQRITPRDLVTHRSGLPRHDMLWYNNHKLTRKEIVRRLRYLDANADLRAKYQYNNLMFLTAGYLTEQLTGQNWENAVRQRIFKPLEMTSSNFSVRQSQQSVDFALPYTEEENQLKQIPFRQIDLIGPAGSINSNVEDMSHWLMVHLNNGTYKNKTIINSATLADIHTPYMTTGATAKHPEISQPDYALGWFSDTYRGHKRLHHGGNIDGFTALVTLFPNDGIGQVVLVNKSGAELPEILTRHATDRILELEPINWNSEGLERRKKGKEADKEAKATKSMARKKGTKPAHCLDEYAGDYEHPGYGTLSVRKVKDHLEFTFNDITTPLEHWHYEIFNALKGTDDAFENMKLQFRTDLKGNVAAVEVPFEPAVDNIVFTKQPAAKLFDARYLKQFVGEYDLAGRAIRIDLAGNILKLIVPGQPPYTLVPALGDEFVLKEYSTVSIRFSLDKNGNVQALLLRQPDGMVTARKKNE